MTLAAEETTETGAGRAVVLAGVSKAFGDTAVLNDVSFRVKQGEFVTLLGPSGCGKTTTLRIIAGFETPDSGDVRLGGRSMIDLPPWRRDIGVVFQSYALFPYLTAFDNVAFGLKMRRQSKAEIARRVADALDLVGLSGFGQRYPRHLSGGQRQRVALARALVIEPELLLLDEPLSNLDAKLRNEMRFELKRIQRESGVTTVFVTHDQEEAFSLSDRIILMSGGEVKQNDTPRALWERPATAFVADFIGVENLLPARIEGSVARVSPGLSVPLTGAVPAAARIVLGLRARDVMLADPGDPGASKGFPARVTDVDYRGETSAYRLACDLIDRPLVAIAPSERRFGEQVSVSFSPDRIMVLDDDR